MTVTAQKLNLNITSKAFNPIYRKYQFKNNKRYQIYYGGSSSGKSYSLAQRTVLDVLQGRNYLVVRNTQNTIKRSVMNEIIKAIYRFKLGGFFNINKSNLEITCRTNDKQILFAGLDDTEKIKSITPINGVITDIWMEEATEASYNDYKQLNKRLRGRTGGIPKRMTLSFNPVLKEHWIYKEFFDIWEDNKQYVESEDVSILKTTYKDNRFLSKEDIHDLENETDKYYYEVYTLGNWGVLGALIYTNWTVEDFNYNSFDNHKYGIDWGFYPDPFAFIDIHLDKNNKKIYIVDEIYEQELLPDESAKKVKEKVGQAIVTADSANPSEIKQHRNKGVNIIGAKKGPGSVEAGINYIKQFEIIIHPRCRNFKAEIEKYKYKEDKNG